MKYITLLLLVISSTLFIHAEADLKANMQSILKNYVEILPYIYSHEEVDEQKVEKNINAIKESFKQSGHSKFLSQANFTPIVNYMNEELSRIDRVYKTSKDPFIKFRLMKLATTCLTCHGQLPAELFPKIQKKYQAAINQNEIGDSEKAYISAFFRDYESVLKYQEQDFLSNMSSRKLASILRTYIVNLGSANRAAHYLEKLSQDKKLKISHDLKTDIKLWLSELKNKRIEKQAIEEIIKNVLEPLKENFVNNLSSESLMTAYQALSIFYQDLLLNPDSSREALLLYWVGILETKYQMINFHILGELYLEQCLIKHPKSKMAKSCYQAYSAVIEDRFTGSSGTDIPVEYQEKLKKYSK